jgi:hypothetical protein
MRLNSLWEASGLILRRVREFGNRHWTGRRTLLAFTFDPLDFMQRPRGQITLATAWATDHWHILDDEEVIPFAITARDMPNPCAWFAAVVTDPKIVRLYISRHRR